MIIIEMTSTIYYGGDPTKPRVTVSVCEKEMSFSTLAKLFKRAWHTKYFCLDTNSMQIRFGKDAGFIEYKTIFLIVGFAH